jgi:hypothetical protein
MPIFASVFLALNEAGVPFLVIDAFLQLQLLKIYRLSI